MDALLIALLATAVAEMGDRTQLLAMMLALRFRNEWAVLSGVAAAVILNASLSSAGGWFLSGLLGSSARTLFFALPFLFAGAGLLMRSKAPEDVRGGRIGAVLLSFFSMFVLELGDKSQFITAGVAVRTADPIMTALGASLGIMLALTPAVLLRKQFFTSLPVAMIRTVAGGLFLLIGALAGCAT